MQEILTIVVFTSAAGACMLAGALIARIERIRPQWLEREFRHSVIAFGGGVLLAAVALILVPEGNRYISSPMGSILAFLSGGFSFFIFERFLGLKRRETPQLSAMLLDYIPESLALGGIFATGATTAPLLAVFIGLQNIPEGFNAYRELNSMSNSRPGLTLLLMGMLIPIGPILGITGLLYFSHNTELLGAVMLFASGGILYLIFQDIAPQSRLTRHWAPPLGAVLGFSIGMLGKLFINA